MSRRESSKGSDSLSGRMMGTRANASNRIGLVSIALIGLGGLAWYAALHRNLSSYEIPAPAVETRTKHAQATVLTPSMEGRKLVLTPSTETAPADEDPRVFAVNAYLKKIPATPKGAYAVGIDIRNRVAILQMTPAFADASYGDDDESAVLTGIQATLGQFPEIDKFQFEVDGKPIESIGHADLTEPLEVTRPASPSSSAPTKPAEAPARSTPR